MYRWLIKPLLFLLPPEQAHRIAMLALRLVLKIPKLKSLFTLKATPPKLQRHLMGLHFPHPVGLAAGFDKDGEWLTELKALGFSFVEVGTVTPKPQPGNPKPRLLRLPTSRTLLNHMGFNNQGVDALKQRLSHHKPKDLIVGINLGKNKDTPLTRAAQDYLYGFEQLFHLGDYFVLNISSPNTPGLQQLQEKTQLKSILKPLVQKNQQQPKPKPLLLKMSPDITTQTCDDMLRLGQELGIQGLVVHNTSTQYELLNDPTTLPSPTKGGLSGEVLKTKACEWTKYVAQRMPKDWIIIGVGGISDPHSAQERLHAGAQLLQIYTGLVYQGPYLVRHILKHLSA